jgi:hypothetical protein
VFTPFRASVNVPRSSLRATRRSSSTTAPLVVCRGRLSERPRADPPPFPERVAAVEAGRPTRARAAATTSGTAAAAGAPVGRRGYSWQAGVSTERGLLVKEGSHLADQAQLPAIDTTVPHSARFWDYLLGGKDNYPVDRKVGDRVLLLDPDLPAAARADRGFLVRAVRYLAGEVGIRQFLDIGTGLPTANNTHQVAQVTVPECRIVYVDNDPLVLAHARALLTSTPQGATAYLHADVREPERILQEAARTLNFRRPVALMLLGIINYIMDDAEAHTVVSRLLGALPSGSYLAMSHPTAEIHGEAVEESMRHWNSSGAAPIRTRSRQELIHFFDGLELLEPGVVSCSLWRPVHSDIGTPAEVHQYCGVGRKP